MKIEKRRPRPWFMDLAYIRDGDILHSGEALLLALIAHTGGAGRRSRDMQDLQRIMRDHNIKE